MSLRSWWLALAGVPVGVAIGWSAAAWRPGRPATTFAAPTAAAPPAAGAPAGPHLAARLLARHALPERSPVVLLFTTGDASVECVDDCPIQKVVGGAEGREAIGALLSRLGTGLQALSAAAAGAGDDGAVRAAAQAHATLSAGLGRPPDAAPVRALLMAWHGATPGMGDLDDYLATVFFDHPDARFDSKRPRPLSGTSGARLFVSRFRDTREPSSLAGAVEAGREATSADPAPVPGAEAEGVVRALGMLRSHFAAAAQPHGLARTADGRALRYGPSWRPEPAAPGSVQGALEALLRDL